VERIWGILPALLLLLTGAMPFVLGDESPAPEPGFVLALGNRGTLQVMDDGSFSLRDGAPLLVNSSHWSIRISDILIAPGTDAYRSALAVPLHRSGDNLTMVFYERGVLTETAYEADGPSAILTVTTVNRGPEDVNVTFRCALGLLGMGLATCQTGFLPNETALSPGADSQLSGYAADAEIFSCVLPDAPEAVKVVETSKTVLDPGWEVAVNGSRFLTADPGMAIFWPRQTLAPGGFCRVRLLLSAGPAEPVAVPQNDLRIEGLGVSPAAAHQHEPRSVAFGVGNGGPAADLQATVLFELENVTFSMMFCPLWVGWNQTLWTEVQWAPASVGNYTVVLILPLFNDRAPADNLRTENATVEIEPFQFVMKFSTSETNSSYKTYPGARFKVQMFIRNTGTAADAYNISTSGVPYGWGANLTNGNLSVEPGRMAYFWLTVQPAYRAANGTYPFRISGRSATTGERQTLVETVEIGPPPPSGNTYTPPGYQVLLPSTGNNTPPVAIRPYAVPDTSGAGWFAQGDRSRLAFSALGVLGILLAVAVLGAAVYQASRSHTISVLRRIIKRALYGLATGDEYRLVIFETYKRMCAHLEKLGYTREDHVTPTEFARALKLALPLDIKSIRMLTRLFEEARYSDHDLSNADRRAAIECLEYIDSDLNGLTTFVEEEAPLSRLKRRMGMGEA
jgi:hypothetical protein